MKQSFLIYKRCLSLVLAVLLIFANLPLGVLAQENTAEEPSVSLEETTETTEETEVSTEETEASTEETEAPPEEAEAPTEETTEPPMLLQESHTHEYAAIVTEPTCTEQGYTTYTCICGDSYVGDYVDATGHAYESGICVGCNAEHPNLGNYQGKVISILSASTSTFAGYIPVADGFNLEHRSRYPQDNLLTDVNETWWMQVINELDAKLGINDSWAGSTVYWGKNMSVQNADTGEKAAMASLTRIQNLGANGTPDVIFFYGGGNDCFKKVKCVDFNLEKAPSEVNLTAKEWDNFTEAYTDAIMRLQYFYPDSEIVVMLSGYDYSDENRNKYLKVIQNICNHYGVTTVDLREAGITPEMLPDNVHPNAEGMDLTTECVLKGILDNVKIENGGNTVYPIIHNLVNVKAEKHYYKGVSAGRAFEETITGEELTVKVAMGGKDITAEVYKDGKISIANVTGDIVVAASGKYNCDGHLQQLPEEICAGTNLWTALEPENTYYLGTKWGVYSSSPNVHSITFPVEEGERIWAYSFLSDAEKGGGGDGTRITWFSETGVLESVAREKVYAEFATNGFVTVPVGAIAVNIPYRSLEDGEIYLLDREHNFADKVCSICGKEQINEALAGHLQQLPEEICAGTNLWTALEPENTYYLGTKWGIYSSAPNVHSITFLVIEGERIWATGFKSDADKGGGGDGTRITWFSEAGILESVAREKVYAEFAANGFITVPEGAVAVNIPYRSKEIGEVYLLDREHDFKAVDTAPTCTEKGYTTYTCTLCDDSYIDSYVAALGHSWADSAAVIKECTVCGHMEGGYRIDVESEEVWIDGVRQRVYSNDTGTFVQLPGTDGGTMVVYSYNDPAAEDVHTQYPTGMQVWRLRFADGAYTAQRIEELDNLLSYAGTSIRVTGVKGIRMITAIPKPLRGFLMDGSLGYTLVEYGTCVGWAADLNGTAPVLGQGSVMHNFAYKKDVADPIFADTGDTVQYTNVLVGFTDDQLAEDLILRPYMILEDSNGEQLTIYGGCVQRSIGYIARQNQNTFPEGSKADNYIEDIISKVYG